MVRFRPLTSFLGAWACLMTACPNDEGYQRQIEEPPATGSSSGAATTEAGTTGPAPASTTGPGSSGLDSSAASSSSSGPAPIFDVGAADVPGDTGCHKADFLFVIDNSGSMAEHQQQLLDSFPGFIEAILGSLEQLDSVHVGVITSDAYSHNAPGCQVLGALVTQTGGEASSEAVCTPFVGGQRFFTDEDSLAAVFNCVGRVGTDGSGLELPLTATVQAVQPEIIALGGCNEGFLRPDAVLVVVIVSDDPPFPGNLDDAWPLVDTSVMHDALVQAKGGDENSIVMIGVVSWGDTSCVCPWCCPGFGCMAANANAIELVESFGDHGVLASVCAADYAPVLAETIETIDATCAGFVPPG
jgi:hypothetical protein